MQRTALRTLLGIGAIASVPVILVVTDGFEEAQELHQVPAGPRDGEDALSRATLRKKLREIVSDVEGEDSDSRSLWTH